MGGAGPQVGEKLRAPRLGPMVIGTCLQRKRSKWQVGVLPVTRSLNKTPRGGAATLVRVQHHVRCLWPLWFFLARVSSISQPSPSFVMEDARLRRQKALRSTTLSTEALALGKTQHRFRARQSWGQMPAPPLLPLCPGCPPNLSISFFLCKVGVMQPSWCET